jgi:5-methylcytosine-specific restriction enzyme subunit McrC
MPPTIYPAREREATSIPIDEVFRDGRFDLLPEVQGKDYFDIRFQGDRLRVTAGKYVGLIPLNERVFIQVEPKMPVGNLLAILAAVGGDLTELNVLQREYRAAPAAPVQILEAMAMALARALEAVETEGLRKLYDSFVNSGPSLKGQIQFEDSVQRFWSRGTRHAAVSSFHDLTADVPENRLLRYACHVLLAHYRATGNPKRALRQLAHLEEWLSRAGVVLSRPELRDLPHAGDVSPVYEKALRVARLVAWGQGVELPAGGSDVTLPSFLVNMESVFERYVLHVLRRRLRGFEVLDGNAEGQRPLFDDRKLPDANPDIVIQRSAGDCHAIVEVKYKAVEKRDDINQVLAYALTYRVPRIAIVLPAEQGAPAGISTIGRVQTINVVRCRLDLAADDLDAEEHRFGALLQAFCAGAPIPEPAAAAL